MWLNRQEGSRKASIVEQSPQVGSRTQEPQDSGRSTAEHPTAHSMTNTGSKHYLRKQLNKALVHANKALCLVLTSPLLWQPVHFKEQNVGDWKTELKTEGTKSCQISELARKSRRKVERLSSKKVWRDVTGIVKSGPECPKQWWRGLLLWLLGFLFYGVGNGVGEISTLTTQKIACSMKKFPKNKHYFALVYKV